MTVTILKTKTNQPKWINEDVAMYPIKEQTSFKHLDFITPKNQKGGGGVKIVQHISLEESLGFSS